MTSTVQVDLCRVALQEDKGDVVDRLRSAWTGHRQLGESARRKFPSRQALRYIYFEPTELLISN